MKCTNCGAPVNDQAIVCTQCGAIKEKKSVIHNNKNITSLKLGASKNDKVIDNSKEKTMKKMLIVVIVLILLSGAFLTYLIIDKNSSKDNTTEKEKDSEDKKDSEGKKNNTEKKKETDNKKEDNPGIPKGFKRIGSKSYGFINIPENWTGSEEENKGAAYADSEDEDVNNIIVLITKKTDNTKRIEEMYETFYNEAKENVDSEVAKEEIKVLDYKVYQVSEIQDELIMYTWIFEGQNNDIHTIFLSYDSVIGDLSQIIYSYKADK